MSDRLVPGLDNSFNGENATGGSGSSTVGVTGVVEVPKRKPSSTEAAVSNIAGDNYSDQTSFIIEEDESGDVKIKEVPYGTKGSIRPDHVYFDEASNTWYVLEDKNYSIEKAGGRDNLVSNICKQVESRIKAFGAEGSIVKQTYIIDLQGHLVDKTGKPVTIVEANSIVEKIRTTLIAKGIDPSNVRIRTIFGEHANSNVGLLW